MYLSAISHKDIAIQEAVVQKLETAGIKCWYAPRDIQPGEEWAEAITKALSQCKVMILIFTENSNSSVQVLREVSLAVDFKKSIIPYKCDDSMPDGSMQYYLSTLQWLDSSEDKEASLNELLKLTRTNLAGEKTTKNSVNTAGEKKTGSPKIILFIVLILLLGAGLGFFLYSRNNSGSIHHIDEEIIDENLRNLIDQGVVPATGEDIRSINLAELQRWTVVNKKLYYFSSDKDSPGADDYLAAMLDDNTIMINQYNGQGNTGIVIPEMINGLPVTSIGESCFQDNKEIEKVIFSPTVDYVGVSAFDGCTNLKEVVFSDVLFEIDADAFAESGLVTVVLPETFELLGENAFYGCQLLESVVLPEKTSLVPMGVFQNTPNLKTVTILSAKPFIDIDAFDSGSNVTLAGIPESYTENYAMQKNLGFKPSDPDTSPEQMK